MKLPHAKTFVCDQVKDEVTLSWSTHPSDDSRIAKYGCTGTRKAGCPVRGIPNPPGWSDCVLLKQLRGQA